MEYLLANAVSKPQRVRHQGRDWLVVSASMIVPGVLNGSQGSLFYPEDEISKNADAWNGMPIVVGHPVENGVHVSARKPHILEKYGIGTVYETTANGKLAAAAWFDIDAVRNYDRREGTAILSDLEAGKVVELSTGLFTDNQPAHPGATYNGEPYTHVARNYRPDHLALLAGGQKGACSAANGCGFNVNAEAEAVQRIEAFRNAVAARTVEVTPSESWQGQPVVHEESNPADSLLSELADLIGVNVAGQVRSKVTGWFKRYGSGTGAGPVHEAAQKGAVVLTDHQRELGADAKSQAALGQNPPTWAVDEATWERAKEAADKGRYGEEEYWPVVAHIYERMGGSIQAATSPTGNTEETTMAFDKPKAVSYLTANCGCWKGQETVLNAMSDDQLKAHLDHVTKEIADRNRLTTVVNTFAQGVKLGAATLTVNAEGKPVVRNAEGEECAPDDVKCLEMMKEKAPPVPPAANAAQKPLTLSEWEATMPAEARAVWNAAKDVEQQERRRLVTALVGNVADDAARKGAAAIYLKMDLPQLRQLAAVHEAQLAANRGAAPLANAGEWMPPYQPYALYAPGGPMPGYVGNQLTENEQLAGFDLEAERAKLNVNSNASEGLLRALGKTA